MASHGRHGFGAKRARRDDEVVGHSTTTVVGMYGSVLRRNGVIHATSIGALTPTDGYGNGDESMAGRIVHPHPESTCWCERSIVPVTWDEVAAGVTHSCGSARCDAIEQRQTGGRS